MNFCKANFFLNYVQLPGLTFSPGSPMIISEIILKKLFLVNILQKIIKQFISIECYSSTGNYFLNYYNTDYYNIQKRLF